MEKFMIVLGIIFLIALGFGLFALGAYWIYEAIVIRPLTFKLVLKACIGIVLVFSGMFSAKTKR